MSELSFDQMLEGTLKTIHNGEVVEGTVISVKEDEIVLNIGYKSDGVITRNEYSNIPNLDLTTVVSIGDTLTVKILKVNDGEGQVALTYKRVIADKINKELEEAFENNEVLTGKVVQIMSGGLNAEVKETKVFIPASLVSDVFERDLSKYLDQEIEFRIIEFNPRKRRIIGDRKSLIEERKAELKKEALERISEGMVLEGTVKNVTDFGAFVDIGGIDGLLHISEMSWGRIGNPRKVFKNGDVLKVFVKEINEDKIALSLKFDESNPWNEASTKYAVGNIVTGTVARMTDFGAFVELEIGVDALLHVSQIALEHIEKPSDVLKIGQEIEAKVVDFNSEEHKISLSIKAILLEEKAAKKEQEAESEEYAEVKIDEAIEESEEAAEAAKVSEEVDDVPNDAVEEADDVSNEAAEEADEAADDTDDIAEEADEAVEDTDEVAEDADEAVEDEDAASQETEE